MSGRNRPEQEWERRLRRPPSTPPPRRGVGWRNTGAGWIDPVGVTDNRVFIDDETYDRWRHRWMDYNDENAGTIQRVGRGHIARRRAARIRLDRRMNPYGDASLLEILRPNRRVIGAQGSFRPIRPARRRRDVSSILGFLDGRPGSYRDELRRRRR